MDAAQDRICEARASLRRAIREAQGAWNHYTTAEIEKGVHPDAARAQAATHLPDDIRAILGIDRYGSKV